MNYIERPDYLACTRKATELCEKFPFIKKNVIGIKKS